MTDKRKVTIEEFLKLIHASNSYMENVDVGFDCINRDPYTTKALFESRFVESGKSDFNKFYQASKLLEDLITNIKKLNINKFNVTDGYILIPNILGDLAIKIANTVIPTYNIKDKIITIPSLPTNNLDNLGHIKQKTIQYLSNEVNSCDMVHELIHFINDGKYPSVLPDFATDEYYNVSHEFDAYFMSMVTYVFNHIKKYPDFFNNLINQNDDFDETYNDFFDYILVLIGTAYSKILNKFNDSTKKRFLKRLYRMMVEYVDRNKVRDI